MHDSLCCADSGRTQQRATHAQQRRRRGSSVSAVQWHIQLDVSNQAFFSFARLAARRV